MLSHYLPRPMHHPVPLESFELLKVAPHRWLLGQRSCLHHFNAPSVLLDSIRNYYYKLSSSISTEIRHLHHRVKRKGTAFSYVISLVYEKLQQTFCLSKIYLMLSAVSLRLVELQACCLLFCPYSCNILVTKWKDYM